MPIKKSKLYSKIWDACDELRGGMDASEYKNYILVLLFVKYVSDKYTGDPYGPVQVPEGATFDVLVKLKNKPDIGDQINKRILGPLFQANQLTNPPDFNDSDKLGKGNEKVEKLTKLIGIFEDPNLDFSKNRADGDDLLGDAYEYLMRHFATQSGKSKGQFYTPTEVSRTIAEVIGIRSAETTPQTTVYDPTCGSGSLLLRVAATARTEVSIYGQEKDATTSGLARMNMILHAQPTAEIQQGNTLAAPAYLDGGKLKKFDYVVANPPFSDKKWTTDVRVKDDPYERFVFGAPPDKQGDYAYLIHILTSLKSTGTGVCVLPHGVLFRGNSEAAIRERLVREGYIKGIIGLPPNLFYGTGIPACLVVLDKRDARKRKGIFMIDASAGFMKDGPKNRLRDRDIHKIVDAFSRQADISGYSRFVFNKHIEANEYNLNLPRYIESLTKDDIQDIDGHLNGGVPVADIDALDRFWQVCPDLRKVLFRPNREGYVDVAVDKDAIRSVIDEHPQVRAYVSDAHGLFAKWRDNTEPTLKKLKSGFHPKDLIAELSEYLLATYLGHLFVDPYAVYQHLMDYWNTTMQDDSYIVAEIGWKAEPHRIIEISKSGKNKGKEVDRGWDCDLVPKSILIARYFQNEQTAIDTLSSEITSLEAAIEGLEDEHAVESGFLDVEDLKIKAVKERLEEISDDDDAAEEISVLTTWIEKADRHSVAKSELKLSLSKLDAKAFTKYQALSISDVKSLVINHKWYPALTAGIVGETTQLPQQLIARVSTLTSRYSETMSQLTAKVASLGSRTDKYLHLMGFAWQ